MCSMVCKGLVGKYLWRDGRERMPTVGREEREKEMCDLVVVSYKI